MGFKLYCKDFFNLFDAGVIVLGVADIVIALARGQDSSNKIIVAFRALRLIRALKLVKSWKRLFALLNTILRIMQDITYFSILLILFILVFSLIGMELFAFKVKFNDADEYDPKNGHFPRSTFNQFWEAFLSVFIVLANDGWSTIYINHYRSVGSIVSTFYFLSLLIIGQFLLLNLFLAILLQNFDEESIEIETKKENRQEHLNSLTKKRNICKILFSKALRIFETGK